MSDLTSIAIRVGSTIKVVKEAKATDGTDLKDMTGTVIYILKDILDEDGIAYDSEEVEENDSLEHIGIDVEFEKDCYAVPNGSFIVTKI